MEDVQLAHVPPDGSPGVAGGQRSRDNRSGDRSDQGGMNHLSGDQIIRPVFLKVKNLSDIAYRARYWSRNSEYARDSRAGLQSVMAGLVQATHVVRRIERAQAASRGEKPCFCRPLHPPCQYQTHLCGSAVWMAGTSPAMTTRAQRRSRQKP